LEIGIGNGFVAGFLRNAGFEISTMDIDPELKPTIIGSVINIPVPDNSFDVVLCCQLLEHLPYENFIPALIEMRRVVKTGLIISLPDMKLVHRIHVETGIGKISFFYPKFLSRPIAWKFDGQHYWNINNAGYPLKRILNDIEKANLKLIRHYRVPENPGHHFFLLNK
jgi:ubiquinone/menaquinone biosynthesis C-methylase UbiE